MKKFKKIILAMMIIASSIFVLTSTTEAQVASDGKITVTSDTFLDYFDLHNDATFDEDSGIVTLTPDDNNKRGYAALKAQVDFTKPFSMDLKVYLGDKSQDEGGADGLGLMFHTQQTWKQGQDGNGFGVSRLDDVVGFKLDTYNNDGDDYDVDARMDPQRFGGYDTSFGSFVYQDNSNWLVSYDTGADALGDAKQISNPTTGTDATDLNDYKDLKMTYDGNGIMRVEYDGLVWELDIVDTFDMDVFMRTFVITGSTGMNTNIHSFYIEKFDFYTDTGMVIANYIDGDGNVLADRVIEFYNFDYFDMDPTAIGQEHWYQTYSKTIDGMTLNYITEDSDPENAPFEKRIIKQVTYVYGVTRNVTVKHVDVNGQELLLDSTLTGADGSAYSTSQEVISNYTFLKMDSTSAPASGTFSAGEQTVIYVYAKTGTVIANYVDIHGNVIENSEIMSGLESTNYTTNQKTINGYSFIEVKSGSAPTSGVFNDGTQTVTYVYAKIGTVIAKYEDVDGNEIAVSETTTGAESTPYSTTQKAIAGYTFKEVKNGSAAVSGTYVDGVLTITYVYEKNDEIVDGGEKPTDTESGNKEPGTSDGENEISNPSVKPEGNEAGTITAGVNTSDTTNTLGYIVLLSLSLGGIVLLRIIKAKS